jgi:hypothetical protein
LEETSPIKKNSQVFWIGKNRKDDLRACQESARPDPSQAPGCENVNLFESFSWEEISDGHSGHSVHTEPPRNLFPQDSFHHAQPPRNSEATALNHHLPNLCLQSSSDYRCESLCPASFLPISKRNKYTKRIISTSILLYQNSTYTVSQFKNHTNAQMCNSLFFDKMIITLQE